MFISINAHLAPDLLFCGGWLHRQRPGNAVFGWQSAPARLSVFKVPQFLMHFDVGDDFPFLNSTGSLKRSARENIEYLNEVLGDFVITVLVGTVECGLDQVR